MIVLIASLIGLCSSELPSVFNNSVHGSFGEQFMCIIKKNFSFGIFG